MASILDLVPRRYLAAQLRSPSGLFGRRLIAPTLNRSNAALNEAVLAALDLSATDRVLEVGFGGGDLISRTLPLVLDGHVSGVDVSSDMVALCSDRFVDAAAAGVLDLRCASVEQLPLPDGSVDKACTVNCIYFWDDRRAAAAELLRVLVPGGRLVIGFSPRETLERLPVTRHGFALLDPDEVSSLLLEAGFANAVTRTVEEPEGTSCLAIATRAC